MAWDGFSLRRKKEMPQGLFIKCPDCENMVYRKTVAERLQVCPECNYHFTLSADERIKLLLDEGTFREIYADMTSADPLDFSDRKTYGERLAAEQKKTGLREAAIIGTGKMGTHDIIFGLTDSRFIMGSMGSVVGEKVTRAIELAIETKKPLHIKAVARNLNMDYAAVYRHVHVLRTARLLEVFEVGRSRVLSPRKPDLISEFVHRTKEVLA